MPRKVDPSKIRTGRGEAPAERDNLELGNLGQVVISPGAAMDALKGDDWGLGGAGDGLSAHIDDQKNAHPAVAISIDNEPRDAFTHHNVEGAIDELSALLPPKPPTVGNWHSHMEITGITDWGALKLNDASYKHRWEIYPDVALTSMFEFDRNEILWSLNRSGNIYPYYHYVGPGADRTPVFEPGLQLPANVYVGHKDNSDFGGNDPDGSGFWSPADPLFNVLDLDLTDTPNTKGYTGGGIGRTYFGTYARDTASGGSDHRVESYRVLDVDTIGRDGGDGIGQSIHPPINHDVISGMLYPADRGVLALVHWPPGTGSQNHNPDKPASNLEIEKFLAQGLAERCPAAILLGQGILNETPRLCDGDPGGIFFVGMNCCCEYDPYQFPGQASGQYALRELASGRDIITGDKLPDHTDCCENHFNFGDLDQDGIQGWQRVQNGILPGPGQVRLGTHPSGGVDPTEWGIPVLGATPHNYREEGNNLDAHGPLGNDDNFFRFRLPYLMDYTKNTGLIYTPVEEKDRYRFLGGNSSPLGPYLWNPEHAAVKAEENPSFMNPAGNYPGFVKDYYPYQISRYRHRFEMSSTDNNNEMGSYILIHFKKEADFEAYVRDGVMPGQKGDECHCEYTVYSASLVAWENPEDKRNWGRGNDPGAYHVLRSPIRIDKTRQFTLDDFSSRQYKISSKNGDDTKVWVSGVAYFQPYDRSLVGANADPQATKIGPLKVILDSKHGFFDGAYRDWTDSDKRSPFPAFINTSVFRWGSDPKDRVDCSAITHDDGKVGDASIAVQRTRLTIGKISSSERGFPNNSKSPEKSDRIEIISNDDIWWNGDVSNPSFSSNAKMRAFFRMPTGHRIENDVWPEVNMPVFGAPIDHTDGQSILYHTARFTYESPAKFGNYKNSDGSIPPSLYSGDKDVEERFLDEVYRISPDFKGMNPTDTEQLVGPGLPHGSARIGDLVVRPNSGLGWFNGDWHLKDLTIELELNGESSPVKEAQAQVAGLPERNPPISDGVITSIPSSGILLYPQKNYGVGYRPSHSEDGITIPQPDYVGMVGGPNRVYYRAFDASFSESDFDRVKAEGQPFVRLRLDGITLEDFEYSAPGPGSRSIAIMIKVPGVTTWMDAGRYDGSGPSKQDPMQDGAGCRVLGLDTGNSIDPNTGMVFCTLKVNVGPTVNLFTNKEGKVPVLVKVIMKGPDTSLTPLDYGANSKYGSIPYNLETRYIYETGWSHEKSPNISSTEVRGLCGIKLLHPDEPSASSFSMDMYNVGATLTPPTSSPSSALKEAHFALVPDWAKTKWKNGEELDKSFNIWVRNTAKKSPLVTFSNEVFPVDFIKSEKKKMMGKGTPLDYLVAGEKNAAAAFDKLAVKMGAGSAKAALAVTPAVRGADGLAIDVAAAEKMSADLMKVIMKSMGAGSLKIMRFLSKEEVAAALPDGLVGHESIWDLYDHLSVRRSALVLESAAKLQILVAARGEQMFNRLIQKIKAQEIVIDEAEQKAASLLDAMENKTDEEILVIFDLEEWAILRPDSFR